MARIPLLRLGPVWTRHFSCTVRRCEVVELPCANALPERTAPHYQENRRNDLLALHWPAPLKTVLLMKKEDTPHVTDALVEFAYHIQTTYPSVRLLLEPSVAHAVHSSLPSPIFALPSTQPDAQKVLHENVDLITTLGGDGTILHAASLFANSKRVPPVLAFSMGTLGFLGEWKFAEYKRAFREVYMSGASTALEHRMDRNRVDDGVNSIGGSPAGRDQREADVEAQDPWSEQRGKFMGPNRQARILLRQRLKVSVHPPSSSSSSHGDPFTSYPPNTTNTPSNPNDAASRLTSSVPPALYALNEVILHRGAAPHLTNISISVNGRHLTDAIGDGLIIASPTGSTAYSLSAGGSIVHPLVSSLLLTPICPRSLSFRPLVLPANAEVCLRLSEHNRSEEVDVSVDGVTLGGGENGSGSDLKRGWEVRVQGEEMRWDAESNVGGVPSIVRGTMGAESGEDHWVGGLNGLLKFNYPFGEGV